MNPKDYIDISLDLSSCGRNEVVSTLHEQMALWIRSRCSEKELRLLPVCTLAQKVGIARQTLQKVYQRLESERLIYRRNGTNSWHTLSRRRIRAKCIGIMLPVPFTQYYTSTLNWGQRNFAIYSGIVSRATELDFSTRPLNLPSTDASEAEIALAINDIVAKCDGIIHFGGRGHKHDMALRGIMERRDISQIIIDSKTEFKHIGIVRFNPQSVAENVCRHLYPLGHRHICLVHPSYDPKECGLVYNMNESGHVMGVFESSRVNDERFTEMLIWLTDADDIIDEKVKKAVDQKNPPSAFWARSDMIAMKLISSLERLGYKVPDDFSVMGFDDIEEAARNKPALTTLHNPLFEMGYHAVTRVVDYMKNGINKNNRLMQLSPNLIVRDSVCTSKNLKDKHYYSDIMI